MGAVLRVFWIPALALLLAGCMTYVLPEEQLNEMPTADVIPRAERGSFGAIHTLCYRYATGTGGTARDYEQAYLWCRRGATMGNSTSQYMLAQLYAEGLGRPRDLRQAVEWFTEAGKRDFAPAQFVLYRMYSTGEGVRRNSDAALAWLREAASRRYGPAVQELERLSMQRPQAAQ